MPPPPPPAPTVEELASGQAFQLWKLRRVRWLRVTLGLPGLAAPLRLVHLTDLHLRRAWWPGYDVVLDRLAGDPPDLICVTGDFVDDKADPSAALPTLGRFIGRLRGVAGLGLFGTLGNHDCDPLRPELAGVTLLDGATARPRDDLELVGLPGVARREATRDLLASLWPRPPGARIVLTHYPDTVRAYGTLGAGLVLSGHTHGGQVCLPGGRPLITHDKLGRPYHAGLHPWPDPAGDAHLLVGRGLGCSTLQVRAFCPAEVWELVLTPVPA